MVIFTFSFADVPTSTLPKSTAAGLAAAVLPPTPCSGTGSGMQAPPATGHSDSVSVPPACPIKVGANVSRMLQVPGPVKPGPEPHVLDSNENGVVVPVPVAPAKR